MIDRYIKWCNSALNILIQSNGKKIYSTSELHRFIFDPKILNTSVSVESYDYDKYYHSGFNDKAFYYSGYREISTLYNQLMIIKDFLDKKDILTINSNGNFELFSKLSYEDNPYSYIDVLSYLPIKNNDFDDLVKIASKNKEWSDFAEELKRLS